MQELLRQVISQARSAWRFRWYGAAASWVVALAGWGWVVWQPDVYEASARVYVDTTSVLRPLLNNQIVPPDVATRLAYIRQALLGRDYLERIAVANGFDLTLNRQAVLADLRERIVIEGAPANRENPRDNASTIFTLSFRDTQPQTAVGVVRSLMEFLIEDTLGANRAGTDTAERFLDERIREYENRLQQAEQALADFQRANSGRLPGSEGSYFERMQRERETLEATRRALRIAESRRTRLREQLTSETPVMPTDPALAKEPPPNSIDARIRDYRAQLDRLLIEYTERHPEVIAVRDALARLEEQRAEQLRDLGIANPDQQLSTLGANPVYQAVQIALNEVEVEIATLLADARDREQRLEELQSLIDEVPEVEAELARLNRDYKVIYDQYQALIQSRETQHLSRKASDTDQVEFRVINPPSAGTEPVAPPRLMLLAAVLAAALGAGGGLCYLLSQLKPVFCTTQALRAAAGVPVLGAINRVWTSPAAKVRRRVALVSFSASIAALVVVFGAMALLEILGPGVHSFVEGA